MENMTSSICSVQLFDRIFRSLDFMRTIFDTFHQNGVYTQMYSYFMIDGCILKKNTDASYEFNSHSKRKKNVLVFDCLLGGTLTIEN